MKHRDYYHRKEYRSKPLNFLYYVNVGPIIIHHKNLPSIKLLRFG